MKTKKNTKTANKTTKKVVKAKKTTKKTPKKTPKKITSNVKLKVIGDENDKDCVDISVDGKFSIHVRKNDEGYSIDCYNNDGRIFNGSETTIWNEDLIDETEG